MERIGERVSVNRTEERTSVVISARVDGGKEAILVTWFVAWLVVGGVVVWQRSKIPESEDLRQFLLAFLAFWLYFAVKVGKAVLWRLKGVELWRIKDGTLTIKDSIFGFGKARPYFVQNIQKLGLLAIDKTSWKSQWDQSVWNIGGSRLGFEHVGKKVIFGKGLNDEEAKRLLHILNEVLKVERKKVE